MPAENNIRRKSCIYGIAEFGGVFYILPETEMPKEMDFLLEHIEWIENSYEDINRLMSERGDSI